ncbi:DUF3422 family protein [Aquisalimonas asiatica]|uniref:Uncharacterized membrane-anchored protein n=1 Tax=Aquisalimonas asiatica TaxID=406100 RepID=A0A1H8S207_9GAMM|nr:DUF3422 domain-containing protein [Aquisalimonas asiatica]SEO72675.1 Uncharacterized membrane-anchored protein [Aquisalimonas asiatica]
MSNETDVAATGGLQEHAQRREIAAELHARPFESLSGPLRGTHLAMLSEDGNADLACVTTLCEALEQTPPDPDSTHHSVDLGAFRLRWERHTEFSTYTFFTSGVPDDPTNPFTNPALEAVPGDWLRTIPGELIVAVHLTFEGPDSPDRPVHELAEIFHTENVAGSEVADGAARVYTDFRLHGDGYGRILVQDRGLAPRRAGRLIQRLLEIETYRLMALLGFPTARQTTALLTGLEQELETITRRITRSSSLDNEQSLLKEISALSADLERTTARNSFRLSASRAYDGLVQRRIENLREVRIRELQTIGEFMVRRFRPAMRTCESVVERQEGLARRISRAADLLRTRVDIALEGQNRDLLASMNRRTDLQLRLQQTVEGLSVLVMSYYGSGLIYYMLHGLHSAGVDFNVNLAVGAAVPVVVVSAFLGIRYLRRKVLGPEGEH